MTGPPNITISGKVTYEGVPIDEGSISFESPDGNAPSVGGKIEKGNYLIENVPPSSAGKKTVRIFAALKTGKKIPAGPPAPPDLMVDELIKLPKKFHEQSQITAELTPGKPNNFDFALSKDLPTR